MSEYSKVDRDIRAEEVLKTTYSGAIINIANNIRSYDAGVLAYQRFIKMIENQMLLEFIALNDERNILRDLAIAKLENKKVLTEIINIDSEDTGWIYMWDSGAIDKGDIRDTARERLEYLNQNNPKITTL